LHGAVNRNALIIARFFAGGEIGGRKQAVGNGVVGHFLARPQTCPKFGGRGKGFDESLNASDEVKFDDFPAVGGIGKFKAEDFCVVLGLLETIGGFFIFSLGLGDGDGKSRV
jgi:hypothetical protein